MTSIRDLQTNQPWTAPYSAGVNRASRDMIPHILASHCVLHVAKTAGKLAAVFESLDHQPVSSLGVSALTHTQRQTVKDMAADLLTEALRFANLVGFDLETEHARRVAEKNK